MKTPADIWLEAMHETWPNLTMSDEEKARFNAKAAKRIPSYMKEDRISRMDRLQKDDGLDQHLDKLGYHS